MSGPDRPGSEAVTGNEEIVHRLRGLTVQLDLLGSEFAQRHDLHATDLRALIALLDRERAAQPATPGWLARHLRLNSASVTALVDRMERSGLVRRERDPGDRRRVILSVTSEAKELGQSFFGPLIAQAITAIGDFPPEQVIAIRNFLIAMTGAVETLRRPI